MILELRTHTTYVDVAQTVSSALGYHPQFFDQEEIVRNGGEMRTGASKENQVAVQFGAEGKTVDWLVINMSGNQVYGNVFEIFGDRITPEIFQSIQQRYAAQLKRQGE